LAELLSELVGRCRAGDASAAETLVARFWPWAVEFAAALTGDEHLAEDVVQTAFVRALGRLTDLRDPAAFAGWFRQIVRNEAMLTIRRRSVAATLEREAADDRDDPAATASSAEMLEIVRKALSVLPEKSRDTAELFYLREMDCCEIASRLSVPQGTVKRRLHDAREKLRRMLLGYFEP
jgi:RNA polymerase sigma-70 factor (ECF subfamily)